MRVDRDSVDRTAASPPWHFLIPLPFSSFTIHHVK